MKRIKTSFYLKYTCYAIAICFVMGCSATKKAARKDELLPQIKDAQILFEKLKFSGCQADYLSAKMQLSYQDGSQNISVSGNLRVVRDSVIWMNLKKIGFEFARIKIEKDSIWILDRLNSTYSVSTLEKAAEMYNLPPDFQALQHLFFSQPPILPDPPIEIVQQGSNYEYKGFRDGVTVKINLVEPQFVMKDCNLIDVSGRRLELLYDNYTSENLALTRDLFTQTGGEYGYIKIKLLLSEPNVTDPFDIKFDIPSHYQKTK